VVPYPITALMGIKFGMEES